MSVLGQVIPCGVGLVFIAHFRWVIYSLRYFERNFYYFINRNLFVYFSAKTCFSMSSSETQQQILFVTSLAISDTKIKN